MNAKQYEGPGQSHSESEWRICWPAAGKSNGQRKIRRQSTTSSPAVLKQQSYSKLGKRERGVMKRFLAKVTAISRAQMTRLIAQWVDRRMIKRKPARRPNFARRYRDEDIQLLAATDAAHEDLSGPALRRILHREQSRTGCSTNCLIRTAVADLGVAHLQPAPERRIPQAASARAAYAKPADSDRRETQARSQRQAMAICASTLCTRAIMTAKRGCITSMPSTLSRNGKRLAAWRRSASGI